jgi:hypothetical protein
MMLPMMLMVGEDRSREREACGEYGELFQHGNLRSMLCATPFHARRPRE